MQFNSSPATQRILEEVKTLQAMLRATENNEPLDEAALKRIRGIFEGPATDSDESWLAHVAQARILGEPFEPERLLSVPDGQADTRLLTYLARAWSCWAAGEFGAAKALLGAADQDDEAHVPGGHLHTMVLDAWQLAIKALLVGNPQEARRFYRRAMELGSQFGTWSNTAIQWTYVASFKHDATRGA